MGSGASLPFVPNRDTGHPTECWFISEPMTGHMMHLLSNELLNSESIVEKVVFRRCTFTRHCKRLAGALENSLILKELVIEECKLGAYAEALCSVIRTNPTIKSLVMSGNSIQTANIDPRSYEAVRQKAATFAELLPVGSSLHFLNLSKNNLTHEDVHEIAFTLKMNPRGKIVSLNLSNNELGVEGAMTVAHSLHTNQTLRLLDISDNFICGLDRRGEGSYDLSAVRNLCTVVLQTNRLVSLAVDSNKLMAAGALIMADLLEHSTRCNQRG